MLVKLLSQTLCILPILNNSRSLATPALLCRHVLQQSQLQTLDSDDCCLTCPIHTHVSSRVGFLSDDFCNSVAPVVFNARCLSRLIEMHKTACARAASYTPWEESSLTRNPQPIQSIKDLKFTHPGRIRRYVSRYLQRDLQSYSSYKTEEKPMNVPLCQSLPSSLHPKNFQSCLN